MKNTLLTSMCVLFAMSTLVAVAAAKKVPGKTLGNARIMEFPASPVLPADLIDLGGPSYASSAVDTFLLARFTFDVGGGCDAEGWTTVDVTAQLGTFWHVADGTELDGGDFGTLFALEGLKSAWCGVDASLVVPFCGYAALPGYGNGWVQYLTSRDLTDCDSVCISYQIQWDSEPGYDQTFLQILDNNGNWVDEAGVAGGAGLYDGVGALTETFCYGDASGGVDGIRFCFIADGAWSDEDGLWDTDGATLVDSITIDWYNAGGASTGSFFSNCENDAAQSLTVSDNGGQGTNWTAQVPTPFGEFGNLYPGVSTLQLDPCSTNSSCLWAWFDDPNITNYVCGGVNAPGQGAMRYGPDENGLYLNNEIWSPSIPNVGSGDTYLLTFLQYRDLPLDNLQFYYWSMRSVVAGCPTGWSNDNFVFYGGQKDWLRAMWDVSTHVNPSALAHEILLGAVDMCPFWCGIFGTGSCHSNAPMLDEVELRRVNIAGPSYSMRRHLDLFQDNFAEDGTTTGVARADAANDILPNASPGILPGDSATATVVNLGTDPNTGFGPSLYAYVSVWPQGQGGKSGADLEAPETLADRYPGAAGAGLRYPLVGSTVHNGATWYCFRMDTSFTLNGGVVAGGERFAIDLNDAVFTPGDTICYVFCAVDGGGNELYFSRTLSGQGVDFTTGLLSEALDSPMEFSILPGGGWLRGGDILYVNDVDPWGSLAQLFFDTSFNLLGIRDLVDRYDVLSPSSVVNNSLDSRVKNVFQQIIPCYRKVLWSTGAHSTGLLGDGTGNPEKSDDFGLLFTFLDQSPSQPGLYMTGDDIAEEWAILGGAGAINLRSTFLGHNLVDGNHNNLAYPVSPLVEGSVGGCFEHSGVPDQLIAFGGCPLINDFDVLSPTTASLEMEYGAQGSGDGAVIGQATPNSAGSVARVMLAGFGYDHIRDVGPAPPGGVDARTHHLLDILRWLQNIIDDPTGIDPSKVASYFLDEAYPNPFNPTTTIKYGVKERTHVSLKVYNVAGQLVRTLVNEVKAPQEGGFTATWDGRNEAGQSVSSGVYFYKLAAQNFTQTKKMVLLK